MGSQTDPADQFLYASRSFKTHFEESRLGTGSNQTHIQAETYQINNSERVPASFIQVGIKFLNKQASGFCWCALRKDGRSRRRCVPHRTLFVNATRTAPMCSIKAATVCANRRPAPRRISSNITCHEHDHKVSRSSRASIRSAHLCNRVFVIRQDVVAAESTREARHHRRPFRTLHCRQNRVWFSSGHKKAYCFRSRGRRAGICCPCWAVLLAICTVNVPIFHNSKPVRSCASRISN